MRLAILTLGSRGDVQPYVALARGLAAAGYRPVVLAAPPFRGFVEAHGVEWRSFDCGDPRAMLHSPEGRAIVGQLGNPFKLLARLARLLEPMLEKGYTDLLQSTADAEALLVAPTALTFAQGLRERRPELPFAGGFLQPGHPTAAFASWMFPEIPRWLPFSGALRRASHRLVWRLLFAVMRKANDRARASVLGLGPATNCFRDMCTERWPTLYGFSPTVVPKPPDWGSEVDVTGYWFLDHDPSWCPPAALEAFLAAGPPPICVGFGSMPSPDPAALSRAVVGALARAGRRGILLSGWGALGDVELPETVLALESAPHDWLYPRVAAVVHHGGAGTTSAALRAGVPSMVVPFMADQWFWGSRVARLGAGPSWFPRRKVSAERFGDALRELVENPRWREGARRAADAIANEDGVARAIAALPF